MHAKKNPKGVRFDVNFQLETVDLKNWFGLGAYPNKLSYCENKKVITKNAHQHMGFLFVFDVKVCGHEMLAHRAVLACCSPYLFEIFNTDSDCHGVSHVKFDDLNPEAVEVLLNYAYTAQ